MQLMRSRGFTLVELLIGIVILAVLMLFALPTFRDFMGNARIRNTADSIANGIRQTQVEAIKRNRNVVFIIDPAVGWRIVDLDAVLGGPVHDEPFSEASGQLVVAPNPAGSVKLTYSPLGQFLSPNPDDGSAVLASVRVTSSTLAAPHDLRVVADPAFGVGVRVCDKRFATTDAAGCPAGVP